MQKFNILLSLILLMTAFAGCQSQVNYEETVAVNFAYDFPSEYIISDIEDSGCVIYRNNEEIGGIVLTNLNNGSILDIDKTELRQYLDTFAPVPLQYEYVSMFCSDDYGNDYVSIKFTVMDPDTEAVNYYHHYLFEREGQCYDIWMIDTLVNEDEQLSLLGTVIRE